LNIGEKYGAKVDTNEAVNVVEVEGHLNLTRRGLGYC